MPFIIRSSPTFKEIAQSESKSRSTSSLSEVTGNRLSILISMSDGSIKIGHNDVQHDEVADL